MLVEIDIQSQIQFWVSIQIPIPIQMHILIGADIEILFKTQRYFWTCQHPILK